MLYKYILLPLHLTLFPLFICGSFQVLSFNKNFEYDFSWAWIPFIISFLLNLVISGDISRFWVINKLWAFLVCSILFSFGGTLYWLNKGDTVGVVVVNVLLVPSAIYWGYYFKNEIRELYTGK